MNFINPPEKSPQNITHKTFFSKLYNHEIGYNVYLPPDYEDSGIQYPVTYHLHGWTGNESSEIQTMEKVCKSRQTITVFPNNSPVIEEFEELPVEFMVIDELIPLIDSEYRTVSTREGRSISGFSMGGGAAFYYAVKYPELFSSVTAYAGTYHHYYHKGSRTVGEAPEKAAELYNEMIREKRYLEEGNILWLIRENTEKIRGELDINLHTGTADVLFCDNEILHLYLNSLNIPHKYKKFYGVGHELDRIVLIEREHNGKPVVLKHKGTVTLETERLILRRFKMEDLEQIYHHCWSDPNVWKWTNYEQMDSIDEVLILNNIFTDHWFARYEKLDRYSWAIQLKSSGDVIGRLSGIKLDERISQIELAYELGQNWWNQGLMTEAVKAVIGFFFNKVGFNRVYAAHAQENPASGKVMQKCGMTYEGTARQMCKCNNGMFDMVSYSILADDYFGKDKYEIMKEYEIVEITPNELPQCASFWDYVNDSRLIERKTFAYKINEEYVGGCALFERYDKCGHFSHFSVRSDLRGQGIGSRILEFAIKYLKEMGMEIMRLHVFKDNPSAIRLYERYGFTHAEDITPEKIAMVKTLTE